MKKQLIAALAPASFLLLSLTACEPEAPAYVPQTGEDAQGHTAPTEHTAKANAAVLQTLPFEDKTDFELARRGLIAKPDSLRVSRADGSQVWDQDAFAFVKGDAPASVNPSLWRQAQLNNIHGLFEVVPGIYQLRGFDLANMTIIAGDTGLIVVDPLTVKETAEHGWAFVRQHLPAEHRKKPVSAIIFTHSHIDHFGGVAGVITADQARDQKVRVIAPEGFTAEAVSENIMVGTAMQRRAGLMYGRDLARSERGHIDTGLGKEPPRGGTIGILRPTEIIDRTPQEITIDGRQFVFQFTPESEAPAELMFYLPEFKAFCGAEVVSRNLHNVYTLRGAKVRNALLWSNYIEEARNLFSDADVYFASHHWPIWGDDEVDAFLRSQRDVYKYIHDQSVRMINEGFTPREIAEQIKLPESLAKTFSVRDYYGTIRHNSKAVYQWYMGWYDANPANLNPLPPEAAAKGYVKLAGGADKLLEQAQSAFDEGNYRWAAELLNHLIFADAGHTAGTKLLAATYDQLGYQSESGPWRDVYLSSAYELRHGATKTTIDKAAAIDMLREVSVPEFLNAMAASLKPEKAEGKNTKVKLRISDRNETYLMYFENSVMHHRPATDNDEADVTLNLTHELLLKILTGSAGLKDTLFSDELDVDGSRLKLLGFFGSLAQPDGLFNIVTP